MTEKIIGVYKITNTVTGDFYIGSSKNIENDKEYHNQLCYYNGETLTLNALAKRFYKAGIEHCVLEAKKYLIKKESKNAIEFYDIYP